MHALPNQFGWLDLAVHRLARKHHRLPVQCCDKIAAAIQALMVSTVNDRDVANVS
jgi:hypothetical protein